MKYMPIYDKNYYNNKEMIVEEHHYNILYEYSNHPLKEKCEDIQELITKSKLNNEEKIIWIFSGSLYFVSELKKRF